MILLSIWRNMNFMNGTSLDDFPSIKPMKRVQQTSRWSYDDKKKGDQGIEMFNVYHAFKMYGGGTYDKRIAEDMNIDPGTVSARRNELIVLGLIVDNGTMKSLHSGKTVKCWIAKTNNLEVNV